MNSKVLVALCALLYIASAIGCSVKLKNANGKTYEYDLSKLSHPAGEKDFLTIRDDQGDYVYANICGPSSEKCVSGSAVCMRTKDYDYVSLGKVQTQEFSNSAEAKPGKGLQVTYFNGDDCDFGNYQTVITLICDMTQEGVIDEADNGECWYKLTVKSKYACGQEVKPTPGQCRSQQYSNDVNVRVPLFDRRASGSLVEVSQRFDLDTTASGDLNVAINCITFMLDNTNSQRSYPGSIVIRAVDSSTGEPGVVLAKVDNPNIKPTNERWYNYTESLRLFLPANFKRSVFVSYSTVGDQYIHSSIHASDKGVKPLAPSYMWTNITNSWERLDIFYGHLGMNADIVVP